VFPKIGYGEFLKRLHQATCLPVHVLHQSICKVFSGGTSQDVFNTISLQNIINKFNEQFVQLFAKRFSYSALDYRVVTSIFNPDGSFVDEIAAGNVGTMKGKNTDVELPKYLYDEVYYDSNLEHEILKVSPPEEIIVYGKLPRRCIQLPTYTGETTTPDLIYAKYGKDSGIIEEYCVIETKSDDLRLSGR
jgi:type III restriction enzyme